MKIKLVKVKNYKSLADATAERLTENNMVFGYNNSGKSNLMQLIHLIFRKKADYDVYAVEREDGTMESRVKLERGTRNFWDGKIVDQPFLFFKGNRDKNIEFEVEIEMNVRDLTNVDRLEEYIKAGDSKFDLIIKGIIVSEGYDISRIELEEVRLNNLKIFSTGASGSNYFEGSTTDLKDDSTALDEILILLNNGVQFIDSNRYFGNEMFIKNEELTPNNFKSWLYDLYINPETYNQYIDLIKWFDEFKLEGGNNQSLINNLTNYPLNNADVGFSNPREGIDIMLDNNKGRYPLKNFGTGIQQIIYILACIYASKAKVLVIEEVELNLSPAFQNEFLNFLQQLINDGKINQLFFTSHSNYLADHNHVKSWYAVEIGVDGKSQINTCTHGGARDYFNNHFTIKKED